MAVFRERASKVLLRPEAKPVLIAKRKARIAKLTPAEFIEKNSMYLNGFADAVIEILNKRTIRKKLEEIVGDNEKVQVIVYFNKNGFPKCSSAEIIDAQGKVVRNKLPKKIKRQIINGVNRSRKRLYRLRHKDTKRKIRLSEPFEQPIKVKLPK